MCWDGLLLMHKFEFIYPESKRALRRDISLSSDIPTNWSCRNIKFFQLLKERWGADKGEQKERSKASTTLTVLSQELFFFFLWSICSWTLWHLICRADEASQRLNWSGFVSSLLSHDLLLYGSVRGRGNPLECTALVGLLFASCRPTERMLDWSYFMLGLPLSSTLLHRIFSSLLFLSFFSLLHRCHNPPF